MKLTTDKTSTIIVKADSDSEWDRCNAAIIEVDIKKWKRWNKLATSLKKKNPLSLAYIAVYDSIQFVIVDEDEVEVPEVTFSYCKDAVIGDVIQNTEQEVKHHETKYWGDGIISWSGYGKHTGEEFWTETINITQL